MLKEKGPLLLACNHPNSFLDSVIIDVLFDEPIWSLARGDAFINPIVNKLFKSLRILPMYRTSEGVENLSENYKTFEACLEIFRKNGLVMIFSEGKCINEWRLRPLKKGTARLAMSGWENNIPLKVLPVGLNYSSFNRIGKNIFINFGTIINKNDFEWKNSDGLRHQSFNDKLGEQLKQLVFEIETTDRNKQTELLEIKPTRLKKIVLAIPALLGWLVHAPLYLPIRKFIRSRALYNDHFDSIMMGMLLITYPVYLFIIVLLLFFFIIKTWWVFLLLLLLPFTAWSYMQVKGQIAK